MKRNTNRAVAVLLAVLLTLSPVPVSVFAQTPTVQADDGAELYGACQGYSTYAVGETFADSFYYTDDWFMAEPAQQNDALALLSMVQYPEIRAKVHAKLADHGFILRYLDGKEDITGYSYEPWHIRYVNDASIAKEIMDKGITLEEYLGRLPTTDVAPPKDE
jgi:hypothetical protein